MLIKHIHTALHFSHTKFFYVFLTLLITITPVLSHAYGKGPIGIWAASERHVLLSDSSLPGIVLVDLHSGTATERLVLDGNPTCIASCPNCDFALITGKSGSAWRVHFRKNITKLLNKSDFLDLKNARIEPLNFKYPNGSKNGKIDGRICTVDNSGENAYIAAFKDNAVFHLDLSKKLSLNRLLKTRKRNPFGLSWDKNNNLLVTMHKKEVWRVNLQGQKLASYDVTKAKCPGTEEYNPNLRTAIDDPNNTNSIIVLASNPKSYDAVIWRLKYNQLGKPTECEVVAGGVGKGSGWLDSTTDGNDVKFSRPHYFTLLPDNNNSRIVITDIDNRALRVINLHNGSSTTVMYDRDKRALNTPVNIKQSAISCTQLQWAKTKPLIGVLGGKSCIQPPTSAASNLKFNSAQAYCQKQGARLCEPSELRQSTIFSGPETWTNAECASCWKSKAGSLCDSTIKTFKTKGVHRTKGFKQSWNSGQAIEIGKTKNNSPSTFCSSTKSKHKAAAFCCADDF